MLSSFQKYKSLGFNEWTLEFYTGFFEVLGDDLLKVFEEVRQTGKVIGSFKYNIYWSYPKS
jgi:hypothetical protein